MDAVNLILSTYVLNAVWQIPVIAVTAWLCIKFANRLPAKYHHTVWVASLLLGVVIPVVSLPRANGFSGPNRTTSLHVATNHEFDPLLPKKSTGTIFRGLRPHRTEVTLDPSLKWTLSIVYLVFVTYRLLWLALAWRRTQHLVANVTEIRLPTAIQDVVDWLAQHYSLGPVLIRTSRHAASPFIAGIRQAMLVIPETLLQQTSEADLSLVLAHELAHLKRRDFLLNLGYEVASIPVAFHPITTLIKRRIEDSREVACDEIAAEQTGSRSEYASSLLRIAQSIGGESIRSQAGHALGLFETDNLEERIMNLLARKNQIGNRLRQVVLGAVGAIFAVVCLGMSGYAVQVNAAASEAYLGTWRGDYQGQNFIVIRLNEEKGQVTGYVQMMNTQINLEGDGEVYHVSGKLSDPMNLNGIRFDGKALHFQFIEEGDAEPVHWRMELTSPENASLYWMELPAGVKFKPIGLTRDAGEQPPMQNVASIHGTNSAEDRNAVFVLGDLKIEGDVHNQDEVKDRILKAWKDREYSSAKELADAVMEFGIRGDFQDRGYFKVLAHDPVMQPLGLSGGKQRILVIASLVEGPQFRLGALSLQNASPGRALLIPAATLRDQFHIQDGGLFNVSEIRAGLKRIGELYSMRGYAEAKALPETNVDDRSHRIDLVVHITEGLSKL